MLTARQIIASNPQLQAMGPQVRQMMQSPFFREMMSNPETLRRVGTQFTHHADP